MTAARAFGALARRLAGTRKASKGRLELQAQIVRHEVGCPLSTRSYLAVISHEGLSRNQESTAATRIITSDAGLRSWQPLLRGFATGGDEFKAVVPSMGESITDGSLAAMLKKEGDYVEVDEVIAQIETDKVTIDVRTPEAGTIKKLHVKEGDTVTPGTEVASLVKGQAPAAEKPAEKPSKEKPGAFPAENEKENKPLPVPKKEEKPKAPPAAPKATPPKPAPKPEPKAQGEDVPQLAPKDKERRVPMTRLRKRVATRLKDSQNTFALLTTFNEVDMTNLMQLRADFKDEFLEKHGVKLGFMSAFVKAASKALEAYPVVNAVIDGDDIIYRDYVDISIAVGTPKGLVVPVLRDVPSKNFADIEKNINALGEKARSGTLSIDEMAGGTFTISNGGVYGSLISTPIVNPPQSAILGMHSIQKRPMVLGKSDEIKVRPMMYVALTYDHRLIDGREAVLFLRRIKDVVEDPRRLVVDL